MTGDDVVDDKAARGVEKYPNALDDLSVAGDSGCCIYKSGPDWPVHKGPHAERIVREPRPVNTHAIQYAWLSIGERICDELGAMQLE